MSQVKRWKLKGFLPGVEGECKAVFQPTVVMAEDLDNVSRLFLDAAERCVASERRERELQQRLTAADERNDLAIDLLQRARAVIEGGGWADLERDIAIFFKRAEGKAPSIPPERERLMEIVQQYPNVDPLEYDAAVRTLRK